jgi:hypothetical protein
MPQPRFILQNLQIVNNMGQFVNVSVPVVNQDSQVPAYSRSPEWLIMLDDLTDKASNVKGKEGYVEVFGWTGAMSRSSSPNIGGEHYSTATLIHTDLVVVMPMGSYVTKLNQTMANGVVVKNVTLERLGNIGEVLQVIQSILFETCRIQSVQQQIDKVVVTIQVQKRTDTINVYNQDGTSAGQTVSTIDFQTVEVS